MTSAKYFEMSSADVTLHSGDPRVADLVRTGRLRVGLFLPQYAKDPATGAAKGMYVDIVRALAARIGVELVVVERRTPAEVVAALNAGDCDLASLGFDPARAPLVGGFSPPFMRIEYSLMLPAGSAISSIADADRPGMRIAVVRDHASTLALGRIRRHAEQVAVDTPDDALELMRGARVDAWASVRSLLLHYCRRLFGARVLADSYGANEPAWVVAKGQEARLAYISEFIEHAKASGLVRRAIERAGRMGIVIPGSGTPTGTSALTPRHNGSTRLP
jgi:polar amino acid transport system substrate-binding protein